MKAGAPTPSDGDATQRATAHEVSLPDEASSDAGELVRGSIVGRYVVIAPVGVGGMGEVVRAYDAKLRREVALKRLRTGALDPAGEARLLREAQAMAQLSHPNVVAVYDVDRTAAGVILAMEFIDGPTLTEWLETARAWPEVVRVFVEAGRALQAAHTAGLVHRDFKPGNVMLGRDPQAAHAMRVRVLDFGLARPVSEEMDEPSHPELVVASTASLQDIDISDSKSPRLTEHGAIVGTPAYMAPEQHAGAIADARCDQYAFCIALWEALWGALPFRGSMAALTFTKLDGPPPMPKGRVPRRLYEIVARGLDPDPDLRWPTMEHLLAALQRDPARTRRRIALGSVGAIGLVAIGAAVAMSAEEGPACPDPTAELAGIWDATRRAEIEQAIRARPLPYADAAASRLVQRLDAYADAWIAMKADACAATHVRAEQSTEMLDRRTACLQRRHQQLSALTGMLATADDKMVERGVALLSDLAPIEPCGDLEALRAAIAPPDSPEVAAAVEDLRGRLVEASATANGGRYQDAIALLDTLVREAEALDYPPVAAEARLMLARTQTNAGHYEPAEKDFAIAYSLALRVGADQIALEAAVGQTGTVGMHLARTDAGRAWSTTALALAERLDPHGRWMGEALNARGALAVRSGDYAEAEADFRRGAELLAAAKGPDDPAVATAFNLIGVALDEQEKYVEAEQQFQRALQVARAAYGEDHPVAANYIGNLAINLSLQGRHAEALQMHERVLAIRERALGSDHPNTALSHINVGWAIHERGDEAEAAKHFERALAGGEARLGPNHPQVAMAAEGLAETRHKLGDLAEAEALHRRALAIREKAVGADHPNVAASRIGLVSVHVAQKRYDDALAEIERALKILEARPEDGRRYHMDALHWRGRVLRALGRPKAAIEPLQAAIDRFAETERDPSKLAAIRFTLAQALVESGRPVAEGRALVERALADVRRRPGASPEDQTSELERWLADHPE